MPAFSHAQVLAGATSALAIMTVISVAIGRLFSRVPESFSSSIPIGEYLAVALLVFFGVSTLRVRATEPQTTSLNARALSCARAADFARRTDLRVCAVPATETAANKARKADISAWGCFV